MTTQQLFDLPPQHLKYTITKPKYGFSVEQQRKAFPSDERCIYCREIMITRQEAEAQNRKRDYFTLEHFSPTLFSHCCNACQASRKPSLPDWFEKPYCLSRNINEETVAPVVREWLRIARERPDWFVAEVREADARDAAKPRRPKTTWEQITAGYPTRK